MIKTENLKVFQQESQILLKPRNKRVMNRGLQNTDGLISHINELRKTIQIVAGSRLVL